MSSSMKKVCATGPGSAMPVVSMMMRSKSSCLASRFACSSPRMRTRSPRTMQQQLVVDSDLAELVFDDGDAASVLLLEYAVQQRGLAAAQESGKYGYRHRFLWFHM